MFASQDNSAAGVGGVGGVDVAMAAVVELANVVQQPRRRRLESLYLAAPMLINLARRANVTGSKCRLPYDLRVHKIR